MQPGVRRRRAGPHYVVYYTDTTRTSWATRLPPPCGPAILRNWWSTIDARPASVEGAGRGERGEGGMKEQVAGRGSGGGGEGGWEAGDWGRREGPQRHVQGVCTRLQVQIISQGRPRSGAESLRKAIGRNRLRQNRCCKRQTSQPLKASGFGMGFAACLPLFCFELE